MKTLIILSAAIAITAASSGCLLQPDVTYTYWKYSSETQMYSPLRTEYPFTQAELKEQGLIEKLPDGAKTTEK